MPKARFCCCEACAARVGALETAHSVLFDDDLQAFVEEADSRVRGRRRSARQLFELSLELNRKVFARIRARSDTFAAAVDDGLELNDTNVTIMLNLNSLMLFAASVDGWRLNRRTIRTTAPGTSTVSGTYVSFSEFASCYGHFHRLVERLKTAAEFKRELLSTELIVARPDSGSAMADVFKRMEKLHRQHAS